MCLLSALPQLSSGHTYISCTCYFATMGILNWNLPLSHLPTEIQHALTRGIPHYFGFFLHLLQFCKLYQMTPKAILFSAASVWKVLRGGCDLFSLLGINSTLTFVAKFEHKLRCCSLCPRPPLSLSAALTKVKQFFSGNENDLAVSAWLCLARTLYWQHMATPTNIWHDSNNFQMLYLATTR